MGVHSLNVDDSIEKQLRPNVMWTAGDGYDCSRTEFHCKSTFLLALAYWQKISDLDLMIVLSLEFHFWCLWFCGVPISDYLKLNACEAYANEDAICSSFHVSKYLPTNLSWWTDNR